MMAQVLLNQVIGNSLHLRQKKNIYFVIPMLMLFGVLEVAMRIAGYPPGKTYMISGDGDPRWEDPELFWTPSGAFAEQFQKAKISPAENLIYCYGGSIVQGFSASKPFASILEKRLRAEYSADAVVINWAAQGYSSYQSRVIAQRSVSTAPPRIIIESNAWNDHEIGSYSDLEIAEMNRGFDRKVLYVTNRSVAFAQMRRILLRRDEIQPPGATWPYRMTARVPVKDYRKQILKFVALAESADADLILLTQGQYSKTLRQNLLPYHEVMEDIASQFSHVYLMDIRPAIEKAVMDELGLDDLLDQPGTKNSYILDMCHPTAKGHKLIADALFPLVYRILQQHNE